MFNSEEFLRIANRTQETMFLKEEHSISESDKKRIIDYIKENDLDYMVSEENHIFRFFITSYDRYLYQFLKYNEKYIVIKTDTKLGGSGSPKSFRYSYYKNLQQVIEHLSYTDSSLYKVWWEVLDGIGRPSSVNIGFIKEGYTDEWFKEFIKTNEWYGMDEEQYKCLVYEKKINIKVISPHNTLHEVSLFNDYAPTDMDKLYMEIHPISVQESNESYFVKILINNEEVLKEYIKYRVHRKKGLKIFLEELFNNKNQYVQFK